MVPQSMEICVDSVISALEAEKGGANRIELCSNLAEGGTTPSLGLYIIIKQKVKIPVFVMIRPRGGDFLYSDEEYEVMKMEIEIFKSHGADGFVFGMLTKDGKVDVMRSKCLRAFDMVSDPYTALEDVIKIGCERLLTSGLESTSLEGLEMLKVLVEKAENRIIVMPGGGINSRNLKRILTFCGAKEFHCSARKSIESKMIERNNKVHMGAACYPSEFSIKVTDSSIVLDLVRISKTM